MTIEQMRRHFYRSAALIVIALVAPAVAQDELRRRVPLEGQPNFRDVGGYKTMGGKTVRRGLIYRSGELPRLSDSDVAKLGELGVRTVVNFLTEVETRSRGKDRLPRGVRLRSLPIDSDDGLASVIEAARKNADFSELTPDINPRIHRILVDDAREQYAELWKEIAATKEPLVFHCSHGVHRTGTATALLLWGMGVPWETVRKDYLLSNEYRREEVEKRLGQLRRLAAKNQGVAVDQVDMNNIEAFYVLKPNYIDATRDEVLKRYGSIDNYLSKGLKLSDEVIQQVRDRLVK